MSMTSQIRDLSSPLRRWMDAVVDRERAAGLARSINNLLAAIPPLTVASSDHSTVATAMRLAMRGLAMVPPTPRPAPMTGEAALSALNHAAFRAVRSGAEAAQQSCAWTAAVDVATELLATALTARDTGLRSRAYLALAAFVRVSRDRTLPPLLAHAAIARPVPETVRAIVTATAQGSVTDMMQLLSTVRMVWSADLDMGAVVAPTFAGDALVGGASVDWIAGGTLWDMSVRAAARPFGREDLLTSLGAVLLDAYDEAGITALGWYFARHRQRYALPVADVLDQLQLPPIAELRERFWHDLSPRWHPLDPWTRAAVADAPMVLTEALRWAVLGIVGAINRREVQIRAVPANGVWELVTPQGAVEALPNGWCVALTLQANLQPALFVVVAARDSPLRWASARAAAPRDGRLPVATLPAPLTDEHPSWPSLISGVRQQMNILQDAR